ncbi:hypothetical protein FEM48_Zijuj05G0145700 [Ziziphus jujuba var. spinosa]|uniref:Uncharacterized protein n=1 Tax=Ziziphus jujuba var. spinosa TaxID=714518 RepID=A0A978VFD6_ZIZJJ|nr:hypothetical protein FEM48_Zijuj05G0145700 [Ziziphus jujuba var. spinosa]
MVRKFWWQTKPKVSGFLPLKAWKDICKLKDLDGLGFRRFKDMNLALIAKLGWKIASGEDCLWTRMLKAKYLQNEMFFKRNSWVWQGLIKSRKLIRKGSCYRIGDGSSIDFWNDSWIPDLENKTPLAREDVDGPNWRRVFELRDERTGLWKESEIRFFCTEESAEAILKVSWPHVECRDKLIWKGNEEGKFSVRSCYRTFFEGDQSSGRIVVEAEDS